MPHLALFTYSKLSTLLVDAKCLIIRLSQTEIFQVNTVTNLSHQWVKWSSYWIGFRYFRFVTRL